MKHSPEQAFVIDPQLSLDTHWLFRWRTIHVLLHRNAALPWVILVPETELIEYHDLPASQQQDITEISRALGHHFKQQMGAEKINFAAIGNVVEQLHVHVIGRHKNDPFWPEVIWGKTLPDASYDEQQIHTMSQYLRRNLTKQL
ncbi:HIT family protein [Marinicella sp. S1101]|uniref:HIT family protein n=1 Tax=Marinicella marina TaxID=2996016 RepID=UPI002260D5F2|nr:HIT family protein [Marinicella marina]MCX7553211.1 HIT family protein [Marinicella marina]MDJ1138943.1 HIT family protein [Marinicella marina]